MSLVIFLATFNRLDTLERSIASYRQLSTPYELVIIDSGSDYPKSIELLERIEQLPEVRKVYTLGKIDSMAALTLNFDVALRDAYSSASEGDWFAVTDVDICFDGSHPDSLETYVRLAKAIDNTVGPHLRVDGGISHGYPLRSRVLSLESRLVYKRAMQQHDGIFYSPLPIDTTFQLFPATSEFRRLLMNTVRVGPPYDAMHLDWYTDAFAPSEENEVYIPSGWSWGGSWILDFWRRFQEDRRAAFEFMHTVPRPDDVVSNAAFIISWCYQEGAGVEKDIDESKRWLRAAIPPWYEKECLLVEDDWLDFIYDDSFGALGWDTYDEPEMEAPADA